MPARMPSVSNIATSVPNPTRAPPPGKEFKSIRVASLSHLLGAGAS